MKPNIPALLILPIILLIAACNDDAQKTAEAQQERPSQIVDNFQMQDTQKGHKRYSLTGRKAFFYDIKRTIVVINPKIVFYDSHKKVTSRLICDSGVVNTMTNDLMAYRNVVVTTSDSTVLYTDSLVWINRKAIIETDAAVSIVSPQGTIEGKGLISDADLNRIEIKEKVTGTTGFSVDGKEEP